MPRFWEFQLPTRVVFGPGSLRRLGPCAREFGQSALLVGYRHAPELEDAYERAARLLEKAGLRVTVFREVDGDPDAALPEIGARRAVEAGAEVVVALGGGSALDAAKGIAALARMGGRVWDYTDANRQARPVTDALPLVAVPTTAGTGSEVTSAAVFQHRGVGSRPELPLKATAIGPALVPRVALVDPELAVGTPPALTAACGADALGHAIEAFISRQANPMASTLAARAVALIVENLPRAVENPSDPQPREPLALAATLAGAALNSAGVTVTHAIAHALGALLHVPHGVAVALATPLNLRYNAEACAAQYAELADVLHLAGNSPEDRAASFVEKIISLLHSLGLPDRVSVPPDAPPDLLDQLVQNAMESTSIALTLNPRKVDAAALRGLLEAVLGSKGSGFRVQDSNSDRSCVEEHG